MKLRALISTTPQQQIMSHLIQLAASASANQVSQNLEEKKTADYGGEGGGEGGREVEREAR